MRDVLLWLALIALFTALALLTDSLLVAWPVWSRIVHYALFAVFLVTAFKLGLTKRWGRGAAKERR